MKITILLHSTSGNTRLVTRYAARKLESRGHSCQVFNIVSRQGDLDLENTDLLGIACPTMYFRPTFAMERFVARIPRVRDSRKPAFLLATNMGESGAHFPLLAEALAYKGWVALGAHSVICPSNYPTHIAALRSLSWSTFMGKMLMPLSRPLRPLWGTIWPRSYTPDARDRGALDDYLDQVAHESLAGLLDRAPAPEELHRGLPTTIMQGRLFTQDQLDRYIRIEILADQCSSCGTCVHVCPARIIAQTDPDETPRVGKGCTGCFACYNACPDGCIKALATPAGVGRYHGPSGEMRELFRGQS